MKRRTVRGVPKEDRAWKISVWEGLDGDIPSKLQKTVTEKLDKKNAKRVAEKMLREAFGKMDSRDLVIWVAGHRKAIVLNAFGTKIYPMFAIIKRVALKEN